MELSEIPFLPHPAFPQPPDLDAKIWRYTDLVKFRSLVDGGSLYMARADLFRDDHEGTTPAAEKAYWRALAEEAETPEQRRIIEGNAEQLSEYAEAFRPTHYVSCCNMAEEENNAMWDRFGNPPASVAITSTYSILREQMQPKQLIHLGIVRYIDYDKHRLPSLNMMQRIMHKRHFLADEQEVRAVLCRIAP